MDENTIIEGEGEATPAAPETAPEAPAAPTEETPAA